MGEIKIEEDHNQGDQLEIEDGRIAGIDYKSFPVEEDNLTKLCAIATYWNEAQNHSIANSINHFIRQLDTKDAIDAAKDTINSIPEKDVYSCVYASCYIVSRINKMAKDSAETGQEQEKKFERLAIKTWPNTDPKLKKNGTPEGFLKEVKKKDTESYSRSRSDYDPEEDKGAIVAKARADANEGDRPQTLANWRRIDDYGTSISTKLINHLGAQELGFSEMMALLLPVLKDIRKHSEKAGASKSLLHPLRNKAIRDHILKAAANLAEAIHKTEYIASMYSKYDDIKSRSYEAPEQYWPGMCVQNAEFKDGKTGKIIKLKKGSVYGVELSTMTFDQTMDAMWEIIHWCMKILNGLDTAGELYGSRGKVKNNMKESYANNLRKALASLRVTEFELDSNYVQKDMLTDSEEGDEDEDQAKQIEKLKKKLEKSQKKEDEGAESADLNPEFGEGVDPGAFEANLNADARELARACIVLLMLHYPELKDKYKKAKKPKKEELEKPKPKIKTKGKSGTGRHRTRPKFRLDQTFFPTSDRNIIFVPSFTGFTVYNLKDMEKFRLDQDFSAGTQEKVENFKFRLDQDFSAGTQEETENFKFRLDQDFSADREEETEGFKFRLDQDFSADREEKTANFKFRLDQDFSADKEEETADFKFRLDQDFSADKEEESEDFKFRLDPDFSADREEETQDFKFRLDPDFSAGTQEEVEDFKFRLDQDFSADDGEAIRAFESQLHPELLAKAQKEARDREDLIKKLQSIGGIKDKSHIEMFDTWSILRAVLTTAGVLARDMATEVNETGVLHENGDLQKKLATIAGNMLNKWIKDGNMAMVRLISRTDEYNEKFEMNLKRITDRQYKDLKRNLYILLNIFFSISNALHTEEKMEEDLESSDYSSEYSSDSSDSYFDSDLDSDGDTYNYDVEIMEEKANEFIEKINLIKSRVDRKEPLLAGKRNARLKKAFKDNPADIIPATKMPYENKEILKVFYKIVFQTNRLNTPKDVFSGKKYASQKSATAATFWKTSQYSRARTSV